MEDMIDPRLIESLCWSFPYTSRITDFGAALADELGPTENQLISHISLYLLLAAIYTCANDQTAQQMENNTLNIKLSIREEMRLFVDFNEMEKRHPKRGFFVTKLFVDEKYELLDNNYASILIGNDNIEYVDFSNNSAAQDTINELIAEDTKNGIEQFLGEPLPSSTVLSLAVASYHTDIWEIKFPSYLTARGSFHVTQNYAKEITFMTMKDAYFRYYYNRKTNTQYLELPYLRGTSKTSMIIELPSNDTFILPESRLYSSLMCFVRTRMRSMDIDTITIPKFELRYKKDLTSALQQTGITDLFTDDADLRGMSKNKHFKVSNVVYEAVLNFKEDGEKSLPHVGSFVLYAAGKRIKFIANRPFAFYIIDRTFNYVLHSGRVYEP